MAKRKKKISISGRWGAVSSEVMCNPNLSRNAKLLFAIMSTYADAESGLLHASHKLLMQNLTTKNPTVFDKWMKELICSGYVVDTCKKHGGKHGTKIYMIVQELPQTDNLSLNDNLKDNDNLSLNDKSKKVNLSLVSDNLSLSDKLEQRENREKEEDTSVSLTVTDQQTEDDGFSSPSEVLEMLEGGDSKDGA